MNIEITPKKTDGLERMIEVRVPVETVRDAEDKAARRYATNVRLPGFRPGKAPPAIVKKLNADIMRAVAGPDYRKALETRGFEAQSSTPEQLAAFLNKDYVKFRDLIQKLKLQVD